MFQSRLKLSIIDFPFFEKIYSDVIFYLFVLLPISVANV